MGAPLSTWTKAKIHGACHSAYRAYYRDRTGAATAYFAKHRTLKDAKHDFKAKDIEAALPTGWERLADLIPPSSRHQHHLSGNSSQLLALALLGAASRMDPSHAWLWEALNPLPPPSGEPSGQPEVQLAPEVLGEDAGRSTSVDYLVRDSATVICVECKWTEAGIGSCSCTGEGGDPETGRCRDAVLQRRPLYWQTAYEIFALADRQEGKPCPLSPVYQAVRNVAAARELRPPGGRAVFALIYDARNPYFCGCQDWPGWPAALSDALEGAADDVAFRSVSWQELVPLLRLDDDARDWAREKYGLG